MAQVQTNVISITVIDACVPFVKTKESLNWSKSEAKQLIKRYLLQKYKLGSAGSSAGGFDDYFGQQKETETLKETLKQKVSYFLLKMLNKNTSK